MWQIKQMIALVMLAICTYTDIRRRIVYTVPLIISAAGGGLITLTAYIGIAEYGMSGLITDLIAPILLGAVIIVAVKHAKKYIGTGDGMILAALGILIGNRSNLYVIAVASVAASVYAGALIIKKKKRFTGGIPFAPFVMSGFLITVAGGIG